jgi:hypothetical protein
MSSLGSAGTVGTVVSPTLTGRTILGVVFVGQEEGGYNARCNEAKGMLQVFLRRDLRPATS